MAVGIQLSSGAVVGAPKPLDAKFGPYDSVAAALADIGSGLRYKGLTVGVTNGSSIVEYWFKSGTGDEHFVVKQSEVASAAKQLLATNGLDNAISYDVLNGAWTIADGEGFAQTIGIDVTQLATAAQGRKADTAVQPDDLAGASVNYADSTESAYKALFDFDGRALSTLFGPTTDPLVPSLGTAAAQDSTAFQPAGTYATLVSGKVPATQLPSFVDDVLEFANLAALPATGETGKIYVTLNDNKVFRWSGSTYVEIVASPNSTDSVPEGTTNLYYTDARAAAAAPVQSVAGKTGDVVVALEDLTNFASLGASIYKPAPLTYTVTEGGASSLALSSVSGRSQSWTITFNASKTFDVFLPPSGSDLADLIYVTSVSGSASTWTIRFKRSNGTVLAQVSSTDSEIKKTVKFIFDGAVWAVDKAPSHDHIYADIVGAPNIETDYFDRDGDAQTRDAYMGQAPYQVVLSNDTRLTNARRVSWVTPPTSPTNVTSGLTAGTMAYDDSYLYILVPTPGFQSLKWARTPLSTTW